MSQTGYWTNRKKGLRGQGPKPQSRIVPKGEKIEYLKNGVLTEYPNAEGSHMIQVGTSLKKVSRSEARRYEKAGKTPQTKPGYYIEEKTDVKNKKGKFITNRIRRHRIGVKELTLPYPPHMTNHLRHRERQVQRAVNTGGVS